MAKRARYVVIVRFPEYEYEPLFAELTLEEAQRAVDFLSIAKAEEKLVDYFFGPPYELGPHEPWAKVVYKPEAFMIELWKVVLRYRPFPK